MPIKDPEKLKALRKRRQEAIDAYAVYGSTIKAARALNRPVPTIETQIRGAKREGMTPSKDAKPLYGGREHIFDMRENDLPAPGKVERYLLTSAQNNTRVHKAFWQNLLAFKKHTNATLYISQYLYDTTRYSNVVADKKMLRVPNEFADVWYDPAIVPYICNDRVTLAPGLVWCGEVNIIPTAARPLSGFDSYTGRASGIFPHTKLAVQAVASGKYEATKFNYTTGTVTARNYIQRKAGLKAEFHHTYGALLVEVDDQGNWWVRQLNADKTGTFYDLDVKVSGGRVSKGHRVEAINWGDIHAAQIDPVVKEVAWAKGGMLDTLRPRYQFMHDVLSMRARNHHDAKDPHKRFKRHVNGEESVYDEIALTAQFLRSSARDWCKSIVVDSNHHDHLARWLREADFKSDPVNSEFYLKAELRVRQAIRERDAGFNVFRWAIEEFGRIKAVQFLGRDESFVICKRAGDGIECGMHGHLGPNGRRGSPAAFAHMGRKANTGHTHSPGIFDGIYTAGTSSSMDLEYNAGPSSWSHTEIVTYANGKRALVTIWDGRWRA